MTRPRAFAHVDVFSATPYLGNPVAVVLDGAGLDTAAMQQFAAWTNLSETTFVTAPSSPAADYRLRIFTPGGELPFAGHPTLGSAHAWLEAGGTPSRAELVVQECGGGLIEVAVERAAGRLSFRAPALVRQGPLDEALIEQIVRGLRIHRDDVLDHQWVDNGPGWAAVRLASARQVLDLEPDDSQLGDLVLGVVGPYPAGSAHHVEVRTFARPAGVREDPVTGSLNAGIAAWLIASGQAPPAYTASQGQRVGRRGEVSVRADGPALWVGGACTTCVRGVVHL